MIDVELGDSLEDPPSRLFVLPDVVLVHEIELLPRPEDKGRVAVDGDGFAATGCSAIGGAIGVFVDHCDLACSVVGGSSVDGEVEEGGAAKGYGLAAIGCGHCGGTGVGGTDVGGNARSGEECCGVDLSWDATCDGATDGVRGEDTVALGCCHRR